MIPLLRVYFFPSFSFFSLSICSPFFSSFYFFLFPSWKEKRRKFWKKRKHQNEGRTKNRSVFVLISPLFFLSPSSLSLFFPSLLQFFPSISFFSPCVPWRDLLKLHEKWEQKLEEKGEKNRKKMGEKVRKKWGRKRKK